MENAETNSVYLIYTSNTHTHKCYSYCFNLFPPGAWLWSSFIAVSGRSFCIFLLSTCLGRCGASAPEKVHSLQAEVWTRKNIMRILEIALITTRTWTSTHSYCSSYYFLALCSLSFPSPHPFCPLRHLCTSTLRTFPLQAFALPNN